MVAASSYLLEYIFPLFPLSYREYPPSVSSLLYLFPPHSIYHSTQQVYTEKEIIALAAKAGVNANSIPQVHDSLIDDGLVDKQKIGGSNYCWSFPAKKERQAQLKHAETIRRIEELKPQVAEASAKLADAKRGREDDADEGQEGDAEEKTESNGGGGSRARKLARLSELGKQKAQLEQQLAALKENDPAALADLYVFMVILVLTAY
jgi:hypothetical protein